MKTSLRMRILRAALCALLVLTYLPVPAVAQDTVGMSGRELLLADQGATILNQTDTLLGGLVTSWEEYDPTGIKMGSYLTLDVFGQHVLISDLYGHITWLRSILLAGMISTTAYTAYVMKRRIDECAEELDQAGIHLPR